MKILVLNAGSTTLKFQLLDMSNEQVIAKGNAERIGNDGSFLTYKANGQSVTNNYVMPTHVEAMQYIISLLTDKQIGVIKSASEIDGFGHRIVNVGEDYFDSVLINKKVLEDFRRNKDFAPLHVPGALAGIEACLKIAPRIKNVAVFDIGFHKTMPEHVYRYAIPKEDYEQFKVRRYGAHGTSHRYVSSEAIKYFKFGKKSKIITCHLGGGCSMCAVLNGKSFDTSMGFTPLEGLVMATRSGDIDPAVVPYLCDKKHMNVNECINYLNKKSGLQGLCGYSDMRDIENNLNNPDVKLAFDSMCYRIIKYIGAYTAAMGGLDCVVFTGGIGEHDMKVRATVLDGLKYMGMEYDKKINNHNHGDFEELSTKNSKIKAIVIPTNEELVIARETQEIIK